MREMDTAYGRIAICSPMPDEVAWSHLGRMIWINTGISQPRLLTAIVGSARSSRHRLATALAQTAGLSKIDYAATHTVKGLLSLLSRQGLLDASSRSHERFEAMRPFPGDGMACSKCFERDVQEYGFSWFRRTHHLPGIDICAAHDCDLMEVTSYGPAGYIESLNTGRLSSARDVASWRDNAFVRRYRKHLFETIELQRPLDMVSIRSKLVEIIGPAFRDRYMGSPVDQRVMQTGAKRWFQRHFRGHYEVPRHLDKVWGGVLDASDVAVIRACEGMPDH